MRKLPSRSPSSLALLASLLLSGCGVGVVANSSTSTATIIPPLEIVSTSAQPNALPGMFYSDQLQFRGGSAPYTVTLTGGSLPPGFSLSQPGNLVGTPSTVGGYSFSYFAVIHYYPGSYNAVTAAQMLSNPQGDLPAMMTGVRSQLATYCPANASAMQVFVTETGANGTIAPGVPGPITGLYAAHDFLTNLELGVANVEWLELHNGTYLVDGTEAIGPAFYGIELAHLLANVGDTLVATRSNSPTLLAHASLKANGQKGVLLVNADPANSAGVALTVTGSTLGTSATVYSYGVGTVQSGPVLGSSTLPVVGNTIYVAVTAYTAVELIVQ